MTILHEVVVIVLLVVVVLIVVEAYRYLRGHGAALSALEARLKSLEGGAGSFIQSSLNALHNKVDQLLGRAGGSGATGATGASGPSNLPADFGPLPPPGAASPPVTPAEPPTPASPTPAPPGGNTTDPTAPGFIPPTVAPAPTPLDPPGRTSDPHDLDFVLDAQANVVVTDYAHLTVPDGWKGRLLLQTNVRPGTQPYSTLLNGAYPHVLNIPNNNNPYWLAYGVPAQPGDIPMVDRVLRLDVNQPASSTVVFQFQPYAMP